MPRVAADFISAMLQVFDLFPRVGEESALVSRNIVCELLAGGNVTRGDKVSYLDPGLFRYRAQVYKIVGVSVIKSNCYCGHLHLALSDQIDRLAQAHNAIVPKKVIHLPQEVSGRNAESMRTVGDHMVEQNHHGVVRIAPVAAAPNGDLCDVPQRLKK
jgi:hypothetical protein